MGAVEALTRRSQIESQKRIGWINQSQASIGSSSPRHLSEGGG